MYDINERLGNSMINHGKSNDRIYLMKLSNQDVDTIIDKMDILAEKHQYSKIFAKIPMKFKDQFINEGFVEEASIPNSYEGKENAVFLGKFLDDKRQKIKLNQQIKRVIQTAKSKQKITGPLKIKVPFSIRICQSEDAENMTKVYRRVFETYPFPIHDPEYIKKTMTENIVYFAVENEGEIIALASSEMDVKALNVEMTDFATLPEYRGCGLALYLLAKMESEMVKRGIKTAYTIARAVSYSMNITFAKMGYDFGGTLANNTNISGQIESMNVWSKAL